MRRALGVIAIVWLVAGCDGAPFGGGDDDAGDDAADPYCHWDCFYHATCAEGVVTIEGGFPVPCEHWTGSCPARVDHHCERGCRADLTESFVVLESSLMCEENRPKQVGDPCTEEAHCRPEVATVEGMVITNVYLTCDRAMGQCVARPAPAAPPDYMGACGLTPADFSFPGHSFGALETTACTAGWCLYYEQDTCVRQGCTLRCEGDGDCPMGSQCDGVCVEGPDLFQSTTLVCPA